jgi:hypothetical protein
MHESVMRNAARRAYELSRFVESLKVGVVVAPIAALCAWETGMVLRTLVLAASLWVLAAGLRWRLRRGFAVVSTGLRSGAGPVAAALALCRFAPSCPPDVALGVCGVAGLLSGFVVGRTVADDRSSLQQWLAAAAVAGLLASLGCLALGIGSALGAAGGLALGSLASTLLLRRRMA